MFNYSRKMTFAHTFKQTATRDSDKIRREKHLPRPYTEHMFDGAVTPSSSQKTKRGVNTAKIKGSAKTKS